MNGNTSSLALQSSLYGERGKKTLVHEYRAGNDVIRECPKRTRTNPKRDSLTLSFSLTKGGIACQSGVYMERYCYYIHAGDFFLLKFRASKLYFISSSYSGRAYTTVRK